MSSPIEMIQLHAQAKEVLARAERPRLDISLITGTEGSKITAEKIISRDLYIVQAGIRDFVDQDQLMANGIDLTGKRVGLVDMRLRDTLMTRPQVMTLGDSVILSASYWAGNPSLAEAVTREYTDLTEEAVIQVQMFEFKLSLSPAGETTKSRALAAISPTAGLSQLRRQEEEGLSLNDSNVEFLRRAITALHRRYVMAR